MRRRTSRPKKSYSSRPGSLSSTLSLVDRPIWY